MEETLTLINVLTLISDYLKLWRLKLSMVKTTATPFHLNIRETGRKLTLHLNGTPLPHRSAHAYLGEKLGKSLTKKTYKQHVEAFRAKLSA